MSLEEWAKRHIRDEAIFGMDRSQTPMRFLRGSRRAPFLRRLAAAMCAAWYAFWWEI